MKNETCDGWSVTDNSITVIGGDSPTVVTEWFLEKGLARYKIAEVFGDWSIDDLFISCMRSRMDELLVARGMPTISGIKKSLTTAECVA